MQQKMVFCKHMGHKPQIIVWDVETTDIELAIRTYGLKSFTRYHSPDTIKRDWSLLGAAWKVSGEAKVNCVSVSPRNVFNDFEVTRRLHDVLSSADILVGHNMDRFDLKKFNTRAIFHGFAPIGQKPTIDTLKVARKYFALTSNKLSYLCKYLGLTHKDESPDWLRIMGGCPDELRYMREYNKKDVIATDDAYIKMRPWIDNHPDYNLWADVKDTSGEKVILCRKCGSEDVVKNGIKYLRNSKRQKYLCKTCQAEF